MAEVVLALTGVTVRRGINVLIDDVHWQVADGERWVILGPNGAGKTTLLQVCAAVMHPTAGQVDLLDETIGAVDVFELRPRIGLASAAMAERIPSDERVRDVILTAAWAVTGRWRERYDIADEARCSVLMRAWGVDGLAERTFGTLSEGERKRVQIARALMPDPELLLLDEPAAGLDLAGREDLVTRLSDVARDPASPALVLVTHHVEEIPPGFTHVMLLRAGRIVAAGPIDQTLTATNLTAAFSVPISVERVGSRWLATATTRTR